MSDALRDGLIRDPRTWCITGVAGFIGSNLLEALLLLDQRVIGLDDFSTGHRRNLDMVQRAVSQAQWARFTMIDGDIRELDDCRRAVTGAHYVLHHAALGSVPASIEDPIMANAVNVDGFVAMLVAARDAGVRRFVYAASSATYGDREALPQVEGFIGEPLSPYAVTKRVNELYAGVFARTYGLQSIGLRYFNIFGARQDPEGAYAAVIPKWIAAMIQGEPVLINGDGEHTRDFCHVANVVTANLLAATAADSRAVNEVYNIGLGRETTLNQLFGYLAADLRARRGVDVAPPVHRGFRPGDIRRSVADIGKARSLLGYNPAVSVADGLAASMAWFLEDFDRGAAARS